MICCYLIIHRLEGLIKFGIVTMRSQYRFVSGKNKLSLVDSVFTVGINQMTFVEDYNSGCFYCIGNKCKELYSFHRC